MVFVYSEKAYNTSLMDLRWYIDEKRNKNIVHILTKLWTCKMGWENNLGRQVFLPLLMVDIKGWHLVYISFIVKNIQDNHLYVVC